MSPLVWNRVPFNGLLRVWNSQKSQGPYQESKEPVEAQESVFLAKNQNPVLQQAHYSPDMSPATSGCHRKLKRPLKGTRFQTREGIMAATTDELNSILKEAISACFQQWRHRWEECVESQGNYFEVIRCPTLQVSQSLFPGQRSDTFLTDLVYIAMSNIHFSGLDNVKMTCQTHKY